MPLDSGQRKNEPERTACEARRIYVCECGSIRVETRHERLTFSPEEFVGLLREVAAQRHR